MRPRTIHELGRWLGLQLEAEVRGEEDESPVPVFLCHPLEALEGRDEPAPARPAGVLYLYRLAPDAAHRQGHVRLEPAPSPGAPNTLRVSGPRVRLRYAFLVVGGTAEDELELLAATIAALHRRPYVPPAEVTGGAAAGEEGDEVWPLTLLDEPQLWREIGLEEHRLAVCFEVALPLPGGRVETVEPVLERELVFEPGPEAGEPGSSSPASRSDGAPDRGEGRTP